MITNYIGFSIRIWVASSDPDNDVHTAGDSYPDIGEFFMNTSNGNIFICTSSGSGTQSWNSTTNSAAVQAILSSLRSQSAASHVLNTVFQISSTRDAIVNYSVDVSTTITLTSGQSGSIFLEIASDPDFTMNVQEVARFSNGNTGTLTLGLSLTQNVTATLSGYIPAGYYTRLRTLNITGTPTFTFRSGQEILM